MTAKLNSMIADPVTHFAQARADAHRIASREAWLDGLPSTWQEAIINALERRDVRMEARHHARTEKRRPGHLQDLLNQVEVDWAVPKVTTSQYEKRIAVIDAAYSMLKH